MTTVGLLVMLRLLGFSKHHLVIQKLANGRPMCCNKFDDHGGVVGYVAVSRFFQALQIEVRAQITSP